PTQIDWRVRAYLMWTAIGTTFGVLAGYFYTRAAKEHADRNDGNPPKVNTMEIMGLVLALLAAVRQIAELGKPDKPRNK
ncbi:MAG: hypothetical protein AAGK74_05710, partial [Chloroflexota bacterium]